MENNTLLKEQVISEQRFAQFQSDVQECAGMPDHAAALTQRDTIVQGLADEIRNGLTDWTTRTLNDAWGTNMPGNGAPATAGAGAGRGGRHSG